jgi:hypothetical protein
MFQKDIVQPADLDAVRELESIVGKTRKLIE